MQAFNTWCPTLLCLLVSQSKWNLLTMELPHYCQIIKNLIIFKIILSPLLAKNTVNIHKYVDVLWKAGSVKGFLWNKTLVLCCMVN